MKVTKLRVRKKVRISSIRKFSKGIDEYLDDWWLDVKPYLRKDLIAFLRKQGIIYYAKDQKKNKKKKTKK